MQGCNALARSPKGSVATRKSLAGILSISHCRFGDHSVCPYGSVALHPRHEDRPRNPELKDSEEPLPIRPPGFGTSTADSRIVGFGGVFGRTVADDLEAECRAERVLLKARRAALELQELAQKFPLHLAYRANELHDDQPDSVASGAVASMSVKPRFLALLSRGSSTPWKIERNPFIFCLRTLLFVVVLTEERYHEAEMENRNFKSEGAEFVLHAIYEMDQMYYILCSMRLFCIVYRSDSEIESKHCVAASCAPCPRQTR